MGCSTSKQTIAHKDMQSAHNQPSAENQFYKWWVLIVVQCSFLLVGIDSTIVNLALPTIARDMHAELAAAQWTIAAYFTTTAVVLPMAGRLADLFGLKTVFIAGFAIFTASSVGCGLATDLGTLIAMRILQAGGAAALLANSNVITLGVFPPRQHALAIGINGTIYSLGFALGYTLGGFLIEWFGWRSIFLVNLPTGLLAIALGWIVLVEEKIRPEPPPRIPFDWRGALLSIVALALIMLSLDRMAGSGQLPLSLVGMLAAGVAGLFAFVVMELRNPHPLLDVRLFQNPLFSIGLGTRLASNAIFAGSAFVLPFYTQTVLKFSPIESGLMMLPFAIAFSIAGPLSGHAADRIGSRILTTSGFIATALGLIALSLLTPSGGHAAFVQVCVGMGLLGLGSGLFISPNSGATLDSVPRDKTGAASGLLYCMAFLGSASGTAFAAAMLSNSLRTHGGLAALHDTTRAAASVGDLVAAQHFVFHTLLVCSLLAATLCVMRQSKRPEQRLHHLPPHLP